MGGFLPCLSKGATCGKKVRTTTSGTTKQKIWVVKNTQIINSTTQSKYQKIIPLLDCASTDHQGELVLSQLSTCSE